MPTAQCIWPVLDIDVPEQRAIAAATIDLPRIYNENHWTPTSEPTGWRFAEGIGENGDTLYFVCTVEVLPVPAEDRRRPGFTHIGIGAA